MALKGNLSDFSFIQLLNLINLAKKTGALSVDTEHQSVKIYFRNGKLYAANLGNESLPLVKIMAKARLIPGSLAASLTEKYKTMSDKEVGITLINSGLLTQGQIFAGIEFYLKEIIRALYLWREGKFNFEMGELLPEGRICVELDLENLIIEGARKIQEYENLSIEIPSLEMSLKFSDRPGVDIHKVDLSIEEWRVVSYINPRKTIKQIAQASRLNDLQIRKVVYNLLQAGLVEIVRPIVPSIPAGSRTDLLEQRSLIYRVIDRIKAL